MRGLRCRDVRAEPWAMHDRGLLGLRGWLLEGRVRLVAGGLGHWAQIGLTEKLRQLVRRHQPGTRRARRTTIPHMAIVGRRGMVQEVLDLVREHANRLLELPDDSLEGQIRQRMDHQQKIRTSCPRNASLCQVMISFLRFKISE